MGSQWPSASAWAGPRPRTCVPRGTRASCGATVSRASLRGPVPTNTGTRASGGATTTQLPWSATTRSTKRVLTQLTEPSGGRTSSQPSPSSRVTWTAAPRRSRLVTSTSGPPPGWERTSASGWLT